MHLRNNADFNNVFDPLYPGLCYFATTLIKDREEAKDIVIDSFVAVWEKKMQFDSETDLKKFLTVIVRNKCYNFLTREIPKKGLINRAGKELLAAAEADAEADALEAEMKAELMAMIYAEVAKLPEKCKEVFELSYLQGLSLEEVAHIMNITPNTVKSQKAKALRLLKEALTPTKFLLFVFLLNYFNYLRN